MRHRFLGGSFGRPTFRSLASLTCLFSLLAWSSWAALAVAQDDKDLPPEEKAAQPAGDNAPDAGAGGAAEAGGGDQNLLEFTFNALGWRYTIPFMAISFTFVALVVMNFMSVRRESVMPMPLVETFEAHLNEQKFQDAYNLAKQDESFLGRVLSAGLEKVKFGYSQSIEAMQEVGEDETMKLEHRLSYIALIGVVSPMIGLLGTVDGMVGAFQELASKSTQPSPQILAEKIGTALVTTLVGLLLAIPAVGFFTFFKNRLARFTLEVGIMSEQLMSRFSNVGAKKA